MKGRKTMKKITAVILLLTLLSSACFLAACGKGGEGKSEVSSGHSSSNQSESGGTESDIFESIPKETRFDGQKIVFLCVSESASGEIYSEDLNEKLMNDAVYARNMLVEQRLGVKIAVEYGSGGVSCIEMMRQSISAGGDDYQVIMPYATDAAALALEKNLLNLDEIDELNLKNEYWDQNANKGLSIGGKLFFAIGSMTYSDKALTLVYCFNKTVAETNKMDDPYELVLSGEWTMDKMLSMAREVTFDSSGDGQMGIDDTWGLFLNTSSGSLFFEASGERMSSKDEYDLPIVTVGSQRGVDVFDKILSIYTDAKATLLIEANNDAAIAHGYDGCYHAADMAMVEGRALFRTMNLTDLSALSNYEVDFGILPYPKYDKNQDKYFSTVSLFYVKPVCIPISNTNVTATAYTLAAMCAASVETVEKSYYEVLLKQRQVKDEKSEPMLDIIFGNRVYDLAILYNWGGKDIFDPNGLFWFMNVVAERGTNTFSAAYDSLKDAIQSAVDDTIATFYS